MTSVGRIGLLVAAAAVVLAGCSSSTDGESNAQGADAPVTTTTATTSAPASTTAVPAGACEYGPDRGAPAKPVTPPTNVDPPTEGVVDIDLNSTAGPIGLTLNREEAPCTTESFVSLVEQSYFNDTPCHRLTTQGIFVLQCGDPTGSGSGGPGYTVPDELPTELEPYLVDGEDSGGVVYPRGSIAMANSGPNTVGSQFFLVYKDSPLAPNYTVVGQIDEAGLATLDEVAARGAAETPSDPIGADGAPKEPVDILTATIQSGL